MKIRTKYLITSLIIMILLILPNLLFSIESIGVNKPITMQTVYFSKTPSNISLNPALKNIPPSPAPLSAAVRLNAINQIRKVAGLQPFTTVPPAHVILTPYAPKSGQSSYILDQGQNVPDPTKLNLNSSPYSRISAYTMLWFYLNTISGKNYMVDLTVGGLATINLQGIYGGILNVENGHVVVQFMANSSCTSFWLASTTPNLPFYFYRCELTQVD